MCLKKFEDVEIRSAVMGVDVIITQKTIVKILKVTNSRRFILNTKENSPEAEAIKRCFFERSRYMCSSEFGNVKNMKRNLNLLFKILIECLIPREGRIDQISLDHKNFILYLVNEDKINPHAYMFHHLCEFIKDNMKHLTKNIPYARLLSVPFYQGCLIHALKIVPYNEDLEEIHENIIYASVLANLKLLNKNQQLFSKDPLKARCSNTDYLEDYPVITMQDNPEVIRIYIQMARQEGMVLRYKDLPNEPANLYKSSKERKKVTLDT